MRVGLVCPYSLSLPGGVQGQVLGLARVLRSIGVEARVLAPCDGPPTDAWVTPLGKSVGTAANGSMAAIAPDPAAAMRTIRALRDEDFDVLHIHEPLCPGPALTALLFRDQPMVGTFHRSGESGWYRSVRPLARYAAGRLTIRCAVSKDALATAQRSLGGTFELLCNGIDVDIYERAEAWPSAGPTVLFVGRHEPRKGLAVLIDALGHLGPEVRLWVASEGPETSRLRHATLGDPRVEWLGVISEEEKVRRIKGASVLCAPSLHGESFGVVLLEGMAAGTPVVATDLEGYRNVARPDRDALLCPPGDAEALARALDEVLAGGPRIEDITASARARAAGFSLRQLTERYLEIYERAVKLYRNPTNGRRQDAGGPVGGRLRWPF